ncbi:hypothetical protein M8A51_18555 [Schlegelella sp. S2-27]|uniref:Pyridoxamine 5'-phosphate oxidase putative domain-containing protein n=1 Tax=Caldimonas mangrovi TaxID=2944811 RepID=A0ABT0YS07_9BURK|nr:hypothetical protein [Caldimonas mangrovi]MCM5681532.1 hypothetical protein [Caldimonas mangrovi]
MSTTPASPIPREHLAHLERRVSIIVGTRSAALQPSVMRGLGCRVQRQPLRVTVLLPGQACEELLADMRTSDRIAVVFSEPSTHRTVQVKGDEIAIAPASRADLQLLEDYVERLTAEISQLGYPEPLIRGMLACEPGAVVAVGFTPRASFDQTPGARPAAQVEA